MDRIIFFVEFGAVLLAVIACPFLVITLLRSYKIPECFSCGAMKVGLSRPAGWWDSVCGFFMIRPYRCGGCRARFHAVRLFGGNKEVPQIPQRVIKVTFRFRNGIPTRIVIRVTHLPANTDSAPIDDSPAILQA
jgi:hypothetical protein